jgi:Adenylylsulphate kinase
VDILALHRRMAIRQASGSRFSIVLPSEVFGDANESEMRRFKPAERATKNGQSGLVVWFTGLSGAGKTTLALSVERRLFDCGYRTFLLDGDLLRAGLCIIRTPVLILSGSRRAQRRWLCHGPRSLAALHAASKPLVWKFCERRVRLAMPASCFLCPGIRPIASWNGP